MDEEGNESEGSHEEDSLPKKKIRTEAMVLDAEETEIASGLRPIQGTSRTASQFEQDETGSQGGGSGADVNGEGAGEVDDLDNGFEDNGVCR
jgi:hypothetical protein